MRRLDCQAAESRLSGYLDEALCAREAQTVAAHLAGCPRCSQVLADLRAVKALLAREAAPKPSPGFWPGVYAEVAKVRAAEREPRPSWLLQWREWWGGTLRTVRFATAAGVLAALTLLAFQVHQRVEPVGGPPDDVDQLISQHAEYSGVSPLNDWSHMTFVRAEMNVRAGDPGSGE